MLPTLSWRRNISYIYIWGDVTDKTWENFMIGKNWNDLKRVDDSSKNIKDVYIKDVYIKYEWGDL